MPPLSRALWLVALAKLGLHLATSARGYGFFGDELYYIACSAHPALGYVDHPPLSIWLLTGWQAAFGESLAALRTLAALFGVAAVVLAGARARELGGRGPAQALAAVVMALAPVNLVLHGYYSMNAVDVVIWQLALVIVARALRGGSIRVWIALGVVLGLGLLNKISVLWLGLGLAVGLVATPHRRTLATPGPWVAGALAALIFLPHVVWQIQHGWPTVEFIRVATTQKMVPVPPLELFKQQILVWNPAAFPIWIAGLVALLRRPATDPGRVMAAVFLTTAAILMINGTSKPNYLALAVAPLVAAGAVAFERVAEQRPQHRNLVPVSTGIVAVIGLGVAPMTLPILPVDDLVAMSRALGLGAPQMENREVGRLDQHFADMHGWDAIVDTVAEVWHALPADERARAAILTRDYSVAGAIDLLGPARGLPGAISGHNSYWLWGPGEADGSVVVITGGPQEDLWLHWDRVEVATSWDCGDCMPGRNHEPVYVAREPRVPLGELWPELRHYD